MRFVIQRVSFARLYTDGSLYSEIGKGLFVLCGIKDTDTKEIAEKMVKKACGLRIFEDANGKTNLSAADVGGELMVVSQFTLYADCKKGNRPSFITAGKPDMALPMYDFVTQEALKYFPAVKKGVFGADMKIELLNDGPFTVILDSDEIC